MEIFSPLMGVSFRPVEAKDLVRTLTPDDGDWLSLEPEPDNAYDSYAVKVMCLDPSDDANEPIHIGYLSRDNNHAIHEALLDGAEPVISIVAFENTLKPVLRIEWEGDE